MANDLVNLKPILQGRWFGHPLHPMFVHIPVGLWPSALIFDLITYFGPASSALVWVSFWCVCGGILGAMVAVPTGFVDWLDIKRKPAKLIGVAHMGLNSIVLMLFLASMCTRLVAGLGSYRVDLISMILCFVGVVLLLISSYLGGRMVYAHGIGVARLAKDKWRHVAQNSGAHVPAE